MDPEFLLAISVLAAFAVLAINVTSWLRRIADGEEMLVIRRSVSAAPDRVWACIMGDHHLPDVPGLTVRRQSLGGDGRRVATIVQDEDGWTYRTVDRVTWMEPGRQLVRHVEEIDGALEPFGPDQWETIALNPTQTGTDMILATQGRFGLSNAFWLLFSIRFSARRLRQAAETAGQPKTSPG